MLRRLAGFVTRRRRAVLITAVLLALVGAGGSVTLFSKLSAGGFTDSGSESAQVADIVDETFGDAPPNLIMLVSADDGVDEPAVAETGNELTAKLSDEQDVRDVASYWGTGQQALRSGDGSEALIMATVTGDENAVNERVGELAEQYRGDHGDAVSVDVGGYAMFQHELTEQSEKDVITGEMIVFPVTLVALVLVFGGMVAALLPLAVALVTSLSGMGLLWLLAEATELSVFAANVVTLAGLGLAIDYSLLMVNRYREELRAGRDVPDAIAATMASAGRTVVFASITVCVALASLTLFPLTAMQSIGYAGVLTALLAAASSLTVLPALFAVAGPRVGTARLRRRRPDAAVATENGFWHRLATVVMRRPLPIAAAVTAVLLLFGAPFLGIKLGYLDERVMPGSSESRQVAETVREDFGSGQQNALQVVIPDGAQAGDVDEYAQTLSGLSHTAQVDTVTGSYAGGTQVGPPGAEHQRFGADDAVYLSVVPEAGTGDRTQDLVRDVRDVSAPFESMVGGSAADGVDADAALIDGLPYALAGVGVAMVILLFLLTGSVVLPFLAVVLSSLSITATFGAIVWIFQDGNLSGLLGDFTVTGTTISTVPVMLFALAFGLAMDYQVFMLSRIKEEYDRHGDPTASVAMGLERVGRIVTAAAVLMSIVFFAFLVSDITYMKAFGIGLPLAVLIDATLIRGALLPATMRLCGRATWWAPAPLRRLHDRFGLRESAEETDDVRVPVG